ncbi:cell division topological specificity factor, chloroplastic [Dorcoceras hygrometricum]|uniref:Cell division topological specificity factor, chloroplastic n=1 Tax=Dorcoceras hygrometricum TaxID=472368 RepID=A0A2Z6ZYS2_9LAMI|nr:cell division topological specificity factor, chloroplastic [Dorcoceras hygrometricum]
MAISGEFRVSAALSSCKFSSLRASTHFPPTKVNCSMFLNSTSNVSSSALDAHRLRCHSKHPFRILPGYNISQNPICDELEGFLLNAINLNFLERINLAWKVIFPSTTSTNNSNAQIAKQRLKMILFSDRCDVSEVAKQKIVSSVVRALSDFVEIESQDKVQLSMSTDPDHGTIYSVTVPVRRVRSEYQMDDETGMITNIEYKDTGETSGSVDVKFDFYIPDDKFQDFSV